MPIASSFDLLQRCAQHEIQYQGDSKNAFWTIPVAKHIRQRFSFTITDGVSITKVVPNTMSQGAINSMMIYTLAMQRAIGHLTAGNCNFSTAFAHEKDGPFPDENGQESPHPLNTLQSVTDPEVNYKEKVGILWPADAIRLPKEGEERSNFLCPGRLIGFDRTHEKGGCTCQAYVDDITTSSTPSSTLKHDFYRVLESIRCYAPSINGLKNFNIKLASDKTKLLCRTIVNLGWEIFNGGMRPTLSKIDKIRNEHMRTPSCPAEVLSAIGTNGFYRNCCPHLPPVEQVLTSLTKKNAVWGFTHRHAKAWNRLINALTSATFITPFDEQNSSIVIITDASQEGAGLVCARKNRHTGEERLCFARATSFSESMKQWTATERELAALLWATKRLSNFLASRTQEITLVSDHAAIKGCWQKGSDNHRLNRWCMELNSIAPTAVIEIRRGTLIPMADLYSRIGISTPDENREHEGVAAKTGQVLKQSLEWHTDHTPSASHPKAMDAMERLSFLNGPSKECSEVDWLSLIHI